MGSDMRLAEEPRRVDQDQFLTILSREDALARFEAALFPRAIAERRSPAGRGARPSRWRGISWPPIDVPPFDRSNVDGFAVRSADLAVGGRSHAGSPRAERRSHRLRHRAGAAGAVGHRDLDRDRRAAAARRRRHRHGRTHPAGGRHARSRSAAPPRPDNSCPMPAPTSRAARRCCAPAP